ncbi:MAG TPA: MFS transporter [Acidiferrobacterales bacterium]
MTVAFRLASAPALAPLRQPVFRALWIATVASNVGTWMQDVGAAWLMTTLAPSPAMVALVRAASALPMFLLALPAGALADIVDRRRLLLVTQAWMLLAAAGLGVLTLTGLTTPGLLLALTFALGLGTALNAPAWQALLPELVPRPQLLNAVALNSASINLARSVGPALGGLLIAVIGPGATFLLNAVSFVGVIVVLFRWPRPHEVSVLPAERLVGAMRAGLRYVRHAPRVRVVLARSSAFIVFGSALWALLPALARFELGRGPAGYGLLLGAFGIGAVLAAAALPRVRARLSVNRLVAAALVTYALALFGLAWGRSLLLAELLMLVAGGAWLSLLSTFNASIQASVPGWVRGRALAVSILVFFGGMAFGSALWGWLAALWGVPWALTAAATGVLAGFAATARLRLTSGADLDLTPSVHWPAPDVMRPLAPAHGPVVVTVEYRVDPTRYAAFARAMERVRRIRRRDGAISWGLLSNVSDPAHYTETFVVESWVEHLRQHERVTLSDRAILDKARAFHVGEDPPRVTHYIVEPLGRPSRTRR